jgi:hypothetical protein
MREEIWYLCPQSLPLIYYGAVYNRLGYTPSKILNTSGKTTTLAQRGSGGDANACTESLSLTCCSLTFSRKRSPPIGHLKQRFLEPVPWHCVSLSKVCSCSTLEKLHSYNLILCWTCSAKTLGMQKTSAALLFLAWGNPQALNVWTAICGTNPYSVCTFSLASGDVPPRSPRGLLLGRKRPARQYSQPRTQMP